MMLVGGAPPDLPMELLRWTNKRGVNRDVCDKNGLVRTESDDAPI